MDEPQNPSRDPQYQLRSHYMAKPLFERAPHKQQDQNEIKQPTQEEIDKII